MLDTDLESDFDPADTASGPARLLAAAIFAIVRAGSSGDVGRPWTSALSCRRRPGRQPCPGRIVVHRPEPTGPIAWRCSSCADQGLISTWVDTPQDLRRRHLIAAAPALTVVVAATVTAALRETLLLDSELERIVYAAQDHPEGAVISVSAEHLEELLEALAAEANQETNRRRQRVLDAAADALELALDAAGVTN